MTTSQYLLQKLELEVKTRNAVNAKINQATNALKVAFEPFVGCKVQLVNGTLSKKNKALADQVLRDCGLFWMLGGSSFRTSYNEGFKFHLDPGRYRLSIEIQATYSVPGSDAWQYVMGRDSFGLVKDGVLTEVHCSTLKADYNFGTLLGHIDNLEALSKQVGKVKSELAQFSNFTGYIYF